MSVKRLIIGNDGAGFRIRQSVPGRDVRETSLDALLFDADFVPGRIIGSGTFSVPRSSGVGSTFHGLGRKPDLLIATARPVDQNGSPVDWNRFYRLVGASGSGSVDLGYSTINNQYMNGRYCTPFFFQNSTNNPASKTTSTGQGGWKYSYDENGITATHYGDPGANGSLRVSWTALEL